MTEWQRHSHKGERPTTWGLTSYYFNSPHRVSNEGINKTKAHVYKNITHLLNKLDICRSLQHLWADLPPWPFPEIYSLTSGMPLSLSPVWRTYPLRLKSSSTHASSPSIKSMSMATPNTTHTFESFCNQRSCCLFLPIITNLLPPEALQSTRTSENPSLSRCLVVEPILCIWAEPNCVYLTSPPSMAIDITIFWHNRPAKRSVYYNRGLLNHPQIRSHDRM